MKAADAKEFYTARFENKFDEFKSFKAEQYYSSEAAKSPVEVVNVEENFNEVEIQNNKRQQAELNNNDDLRKELDKLNNSNSESQAPSETTSTSSTSSSSTASSSSSAGSSSANAVVETASTAAGTVASVTVTVAAVAVSGVVGDILNEEDPQLILDTFYSAVLEDTFDTGSDYAVITINKSDMVMEGDSIKDSYEIEIIIDDTTSKKIEIENDKDEYLVTGLAPSTEYNYNINYAKYIEPSARKRAFEPPVTRYTSTFTSGEAGGNPTLILDKEGTRVTLDEVNHLATIDYSLYLSNYDDTTVSPTLTVSKNSTTYVGAVDNFNELSNWDIDHFFKGQITNTTREKLYFNVFGGPDYSSFDVVSSLEYLTEIPMDYTDYHIINLNEGTNIVSELEYMIVGGTVRDFKDGFELGNVYAMAEQFDENGTSMGEEEASVNIEESTMSYDLEVTPKYGTKSTLFKLYEGDTGALIYESPKYDYDCDQSYQGFVTVVEPTDGEIISYNDDGTVTFRFNTGFSNNGENVFGYKVEAIDEGNNVLTNYEGTDAVIDLTVPENTNFSLRYTKIGYFPNEDHVYGTEYSTGKTIAKEPKLELASEPSFNGQYWTVDYTCDTIYSYDELSAELEFTCGGNTYNITVPTISATGTIVLDCVNFEPQDATLNGELRFSDNQTTTGIYSSTIESVNYQMNWEFNIDRTIVNTTKTCQPVEFNMSYLCPNNYTLQFTNNDGLVETSELTDIYAIYNPSQTDYTMTVNLLDKDGTIIKTKDVNVDLTAATLANDSRTFSSTCPNPGDAAISYNDDGTYNVYRKMSVTLDSTSPDNFFYDAELVHDSKYIESTSEYVESEVIHDISQNEYSAIEDIPNQYYSLRYYNVYLSNNVYYQFNETYPSGGFDPIDESSISGSATYDAGTDTTTLTVTNSSYLVVENRFEVDGTEYKMETFPDYPEGSYDISIPGNAIGKTLKVHAGETYDYTYSSFASATTMKGSRYHTFTCTITEV